MPRDRNSLLAGRNSEQLSEQEIRNVANTFLGMDRAAPFKHEPGARTRFRVFVGEDGNEECEIVFGPDIFPGRGVADPNSALELAGAVAHELSHWHRHINKTEIDEQELEEIDEALTSLEAIQRYPRELSNHDIHQLVGDAILRLQLYAQRLTGR